MVLVEDFALPPDRAESVCRGLLVGRAGRLRAGLLTGNLDPDTLPRSICAAGHKAMYNAAVGRAAQQAEFLRELDPAAGRRCAERYATPALPADQKAGGLAADVARKVGLPPGMPVAVGAFDAHMGAVGAGIKPGTLVKIIGTSTCDMMVAPLDRPLPDIPGLCGIVPGSILPGMYGLEAGQSAVGDIFNWFVKYLAPAAHTGQRRRRTEPDARGRAAPPRRKRAAGPRLEQRQPHDPGRSAAVRPAGRARRCTPRPPRSIGPWSRRPPSGP